MIDLRGFFSKEAIERHLKALPVIKTPVMDIMFGDRRQLPFAIVGVDELLQVIHELPVVRRGSGSIAAGDETRNYTFIEPLAINPHTNVTAADLNNLKVIGAGDKKLWVRGKIDLLRRGCRKTTEALCAQALTGTITWPVQLEAGGWEVYTINFGNPLSYNPAVLFSDAAAKLKDVFVTLTEMQEALQKEGYGGEVEIWAGKDAYNALFVVAENSKTTAKIRVEISEQGINIGGFLVKRRAEQYRNPQTKTFTPVVANKDIKMLAKDASTRLIYCAVDDLDANLQAMPFFAKPIVTQNPSGIQVVAQSKPLPVPNVKGICDATVAV